MLGKLLFFVLRSRPFPSCCEPHYQSEAKSKVFIMKISFYSYANKTNFHTKSFALSLGFIMRFTATCKWTIVSTQTILHFLMPQCLPVTFSCYFNVPSCALWSVVICVMSQTLFQYKVDIELFKVKKAGLSWSVWSGKDVTAEFFFHSR